ncbi:MAG: hypothetical protein J1F36_03665 [Clostridiales bacterium]|nr:hypothetical protein [Clostridiales bacterium]
MDQNAKSCVIIGDTNAYIFYCGDALADAVMHLVTDLNIRHFFNDNNSLFQTLINNKISFVKNYYKEDVSLTYLMYNQLKPNTMVNTYYNHLTQSIGQNNKTTTTKSDEFILPINFDDCIYLPEKRMYTKNSITYSAKHIIGIVDYVLVGTKIEDDGHQLTLDHADKSGKPIIKLSDICPEILTADINKHRLPINDVL